MRGGVEYSRRATLIDLWPRRSRQWRWSRRLDLDRPRAAASDSFHGTVATYGTSRVYGSFGTTVERRGKKKGSKVRKTL